MTGGKTYDIETTQFADLLSQEVEIEWFIVDCGNRNTRIALLLMPHIKLLQKIDFRSGGSFD